MGTSEGQKMTATLRTSQTRITSTEPSVKNDEDNRALVGERRTMARARAGLGPPLSARAIRGRDRDRRGIRAVSGGTYPPRPARPDGTRLHRDFEAAPISRVASARR